MLGKILQHKIAASIVYVVIFVVFIMGVIGIWWSIEDPHMIEVHNAKTSVPQENGTIFTGIPIRPAELKPGGISFMHLDYCKLKSKEGKVVARLVGQKFTVRLTWPDDNTGAGCTNAEVPIPIPENQGDDTYYVEFEVLYHVNPLKDRDVILRSDTFKISE